MKTFIVNVYKNKKWITLGLSILSLLMLCFPLRSYTTSSNRIMLPFWCYSLANIKFLPNMIRSLSHYEEFDLKLRFQFLITTDIILFILIVAYFILTIVSLICIFKRKKIQFVWSIALDFAIILIGRISYNIDGNDVTYFIRSYPTIYIFAIILILDIIYLILEKHYLRPDYDTRVATRKAERQAKQEAALKQSPEYRIEQLEKELQELKSQVKSDDDSQD